MIHFPPREFDIIRKAINSYVGSLNDTDFDVQICVDRIYLAIEEAGLIIIKKKEK